MAGVIGVGASYVSRALMKLDHHQAVSAGERRVFFRDTKPYEAPDSLDDLRGPARGVLELPHYVYWGPERTVGPDAPSGIRKAYQTVLCEGTANDQALILNRGVLQREWV